MRHEPYAIAPHVQLHERTHYLVGDNGRSLRATVIRQICTVAVLVQEVLNLHLVALYEYKARKS